MMRSLRIALGLFFLGLLVLLGRPASAAVAVAHTYTYTGTSNTTAVTFTESTTPANNDMQVVVIGYATNVARSITPPAGWTQGNTGSNCLQSNNSTAVVEFYRVFQTGDSTSLSFTVNNGSGATADGVLYHITGASAFAPQGVCVTTGYSNSSSPTIGQIYAITQGALGIAAMSPNNTVTSITSPTGGWTLDQNTTTGHAHGIATFLQSSFPTTPTTPNTLGYTLSAANPQAILMMTVESSTAAFQSISSATYHNRAGGHFESVDGINIRPIQTGYTGAPNWLPLLGDLGVVHLRGFDTTFSHAQIASLVLPASTTYGMHWDFSVNICDSDSLILDRLSYALSIGVIVDTIEPPNEMDAGGGGGSAFPKVCGGSIGTIASWQAYYGSTSGVALTTGGRWGQINAEVTAIAPFITVLTPSLTSSGSFLTIAQCALIAGCSGTPTGVSPYTGVANGIGLHDYPYYGLNPINVGGNLIAWGCNRSQTLYYNPSISNNLFNSGALPCANAANGGPWTSTTIPFLSTEWGYTSDTTATTPSPSWLTDPTAAKYITRFLEDYHYQGFTGSYLFELYCGASGYQGFCLYNQTGSAYTTDYAGIQPGQGAFINYTAFKSLLSYYKSLGTGTFPGNTIQYNITGGTTYTATNGTTNVIYPNVVQGDKGTVSLEFHLEVESETPGSGSANTITPQTVAITLPTTYNPNAINSPQYCSMSFTNGLITCTPITFYVNSYGVWEYDASVTDGWQAVQFASSVIPGATGPGGTGQAVGNGPNPASGGAIGNGQY